MSSFWVSGIEGQRKLGPTNVQGERTPEAAIGAFIESLGFDGIEWDEGECEVWENELGGQSRKFRVAATYRPYEGEDAEDGEVECELTIEELES